MQIEVNWNELSHGELIGKLSELVKTERKITYEVLRGIYLVQKKEIYLELGYGSLHDFLVRHCHYSETAAYRRIAALKTLVEVPEVGEALKSGELNLSQLSKIQEGFRKAEKQLAEPSLPLFEEEETPIRSAGVEKKREIINLVKSKNTRETEKILAKELNLSANYSEKQTSHRDDSTTLSIHLTAEQMGIFEQARSLASNTLGSASLGDLVTMLAKNFIQKKLGKNSLKAGAEGKVDATKPEGAMIQKSQKAPRRGEVSRSRNTNEIGEDFPVSHSDKESDKGIDHRPGERIYLAKRIRSVVLRRAHYQCEHVDAKTGVKCCSRKFLEIDHCKPLSFGGDNSIGNLRALCSQHNKLSYKKLCANRFKR